MTRCGFALALALIAPVAAAHAQTPSPVAAAMSEELQAVTWGVPYAAWQSARRQAACEQFAAPPDAVVDDGVGGAEYWSDRCRQSLPSMGAEWFFYAVSPRDPVVLTLEQFRASADGLPANQLLPAYRELSNQLSTLYGAAQPMRDVDVDEFGAASWQNILRWRNSELEIYLYVDGRFAPPRLKLQARHKGLIDMLAAGHRFEDGMSTLSADSGTALDAQLAKQLGTEFPDPAALLSLPDQGAQGARGGQDGLGAQDEESLLKALTALLDAAQASRSDRRAMLLLAADRLAGRVVETRADSGTWDEARQRLGTYGLHFEWSDDDGAWEYLHDLLWRIWKEQSGTPSGSQAFLLLLARGWNTQIGCRSGSDQFREVIANGEPFLRARRGTPDRKAIVLLLAQSYETWWSLSRASDRDEHADPKKHQEGAASAREKAIAYYEELLPLSETPEGTYASLALPRLKLGIDTGQRRFFCVDR